MYSGLCFPESETTCSSPTDFIGREGEMVEVSCMLKFGGRWPPIMSVKNGAYALVATEDLSEFNRDEANGSITGGVIRHAVRWNANIDLHETNYTAITVMSSYNQPDDVIALPEVDTIAIRRDAFNLPPYTHFMEFFIYIHCKYNIVLPLYNNINLIPIKIFDKTFYF